MARRAAALGIETANLIPTQRSRRPAAQQAQMQAAMQQSSPSWSSQYGQYRTATDVADTNQETQLAVKAGEAPPAAPAQ
jgi:hypothetical protein